MHHPIGLNESAQRVSQGRYVRCAFLSYALICKSTNTRSQIARRSFLQGAMAETVQKRVLATSPSERVSIKLWTSTTKSTESLHATV